MYGACNLKVISRTIFWTICRNQELSLKIHFMMVFFNDFKKLKLILNQYYCCCTTPRFMMTAIGFCMHVNFIKNGQFYWAKLFFKSNKTKFYLLIYMYIHVLKAILERGVYIFIAYGMFMYYWGSYNTFTFYGIYNDTDWRRWSPNNIKYSGNSKWIVKLISYARSTIYFIE